MADSLLVPTLAHFEAGAFHNIADHGARVGRMAQALGLATGFEQGHAEVLGRAAALHDVGKLYVSPAILNKPGRLSAEEMAHVHKHPQQGHDLLIAEGTREMRLAARIALEHHECWDGSGYPDGLKGDAITKEARLVTLCDAYDAVRSERPYKKALDHDAAIALLLGGDEKTWSAKFDPTLLNLLEQRPELLRSIYDTIS